MGFFIVSGRMVNPIPVTPSWMKAKGIPEFNLGPEPNYRDLDKRARAGTLLCSTQQHCCLWKVLSVPKVNSLVNHFQSQWQYENTLQYLLFVLMLAKWWENRRVQSEGS